MAKGPHNQKKNYKASLPTGRSRPTSSWSYLNSSESDTTFESWASGRKSAKQAAIEYHLERIREEIKNVCTEEELEEIRDALDCLEDINDGEWEEGDGDDTSNDSLDATQNLFGGKVTMQYSGTVEVKIPEEPETKTVSFESPDDVSFELEYNAEEE